MLLSYNQRLKQNGRLGQLFESSCHMQMQDNHEVTLPLV